MSRIRGPYVRLCERDEAVTPHPTRYVDSDWRVEKKIKCAAQEHYLKVDGKGRLMRESKWASNVYWLAT